MAVKRALSVVLVVAVALVAAGVGFVRRPAGVASEGLQGKLIISGSSTVAPLMVEVGKRFEAMHPGVRVDVQTGGSSRGVADVRGGLADIGMVSRALKSEEADLRGRTVALDGICVIVHRSNPVKELSDEQVVGIYTGRITDWKDVGGANGPITVVNKAEGRSTLELFVQHFGLRSEDLKAHVVIGDNQQGIKTVAGNVGSIGYVSIGSAECEAAEGVAIKLLPLKGVAATTENVRGGSFPLSRPLNLVTRGEPSGLAEAFLGYACSEAVSDLVREQFFVPISR